MTAKNARYENVSDDSELLILVDENDNEIGTISKAEAHDASGILHRAFSLFIFNDRNEVLLQQRSPEKRLWAGYWANSCCSHPRRGETMDEAVHRRLAQELGMTAELEFVYKFIYHAEFGEHGSEHELCWVYVGRATSEANPNVSEVAAWRWLTPSELDAEIGEAPERFTPWLKLEWERLKKDFADRLPTG